MSINRPIPRLAYNAVSAYTIQVWELLSQLDEEVRWVWPLSRGSWIKWLFLFIRYGSLALQGALLYQTIYLQYHDYSSSACNSWSILRLLTPNIIGPLAQVTLVSRIYALYSRKIWIKRFVMLLYVVQVVGSFIIWIIVIVHTPKTYGPRCQARSHLGKWPYISIGFSSTALDCVLIALTIFKAIRLSRISNAPSILRVVVRDGTWAFMLLTVVTIIVQSFVLSGDRISQAASLNLPI